MTPYFPPTFSSLISNAFPESWSANDNVRVSSIADQTIEVSHLIISSLETIGSMAGVPFINEAAGIALRIMAVVRDIRTNNEDYRELASDVCGLVYTIIVECQNMMKDGQNVPERIQAHIIGLVRNLTDIERFAKERVKRGLMKKIIHHSRDKNEIARFRTLLRQSLDVFGIQANISIQQNLARIVLDMKEQREELKVNLEQQNNARRHAEEDIASKLEILRMQEEDRKEEKKNAKHRIDPDCRDAMGRKHDAERQMLKAEAELKRIKAERNRLKKEKDALAAEMNRRPIPSPQSAPRPNQFYTHTFPRPDLRPGPCCPPLYGIPPIDPSPPYPGFPYGNVSMNNIIPDGMFPGMVSGTPPIHNGGSWNCGNVYSTVIENVGNDYSVRSSRGRRRRSVSE